MLKAYKEYLTVSVFAVLGFFAAGYVAGHYLKKDKVIYVDVPITVIDTTYVPVHEVHFIHAPATHDTVLQCITTAIHDTVYQVDVARIDTVLRVDDQIYGRLSVDYYPRPWDWFNIDFAPEPLPVITVTKYIDKPRKFYEQSWWTPAMMAVTGAVVLQAKK